MFARQTGTLIFFVLEIQVYYLTSSIHVHSRGLEILTLFKNKVKYLLLP